MLVVGVWELLKNAKINKTKILAELGFLFIIFIYILIKIKTLFYELLNYIMDNGYAIMKIIKFDIEKFLIAF